MNVSTVFDLLSSDNYEDNPVCIFTYEHEYPVLFFSALLQRLKQLETISLKNISDVLENRERFDTEIQTTFLGKRLTLWLGSISTITSSSEQLKIFTACASYRGPHRLLFCIATKDIPKSFSSYVIINVDQELTAIEKNRVISFLYPSLTYAAIQKIEGILHSTSLDMLVVLAQYGMVIGRNADAFVKDWLPKLITSESSLFLLSQYFFAKKSSLFWNCWNTIKDEYPSTFWTVFWSEQLWRAYYVVVMQQNNMIVDARKMAYRLPFSFIQKDWRLISLEELSHAQQMLYQIEWRIKNGGSEDHFDLFFQKFLTVY